MRHAITTATAVATSGERLRVSGGTTLDGEALGVIATVVRGDNLDVIGPE